MRVPKFFAFLSASFTLEEETSLLEYSSNKMFNFSVFITIIFYWCKGINFLLHICATYLHRYKIYISY